MFAFVGLISLGESCVWGRICIQGWVVNRRSLHSAPDGAPVETTNLRFSLMVVIGKVNSRSLHCAPHARRSGRDDTSLVEPQGRPQRCHPDRSGAQWRDLLFTFPIANLDKSDCQSSLRDLPVATR